MLSCFWRAANIRRSILCYSTRLLFHNPIFFLVYYSVYSPTGRSKLFPRHFWVLYTNILLFLPPPSAGKGFFFIFIFFLFSLHLQWGFRGFFHLGFKGKRSNTMLPHTRGPCSGYMRGKGLGYIYTDTRWGILIFMGKIWMR